MESSASERATRLSDARGVLARIWVILKSGSPAREDETRARTVVLQQLMLSGAVVVLFLIGMLLEQHLSDPLFLTGAFGILLLTFVAFAVPWNRYPVWVSIALPALDALGVLAMRVAEPTSGVAMLWVFPAIWLSSSFGVLGYLLASFGISGMYWFAIRYTGATPSVLGNIILPIMVIAVSTSTYFSFRRYHAQRQLLDKQATLLSRTLERTQHQERLVTQVLDSVDFGVMLIGIDGTIEVTNEAHDRVDRSLRDAQGERLPIFAADGRTPVADADLPLQRAQDGEVFDDSIIVVGAPGSPQRSISVSARRLVDSRGVDAGAVVVGRDVTAERTALQARDNVVASISHELRSPLTAILGYIDLALERDDLPSGVSDDLQIASDSAERMTSIISEILAASSSSNATMDVTISRSDADLGILVLEAAQAWEPAASARHIQIITTGVDWQIRAYMDAPRIRQVIDNLISNAIKYGRDGGAIWLDVYGDEIESWVAVRDNGMGIAEEDQQRLFGRFVRANTEVGGTGLGLAISRDIARAHGGEIYLGSTVGQGSAFILRLPARVDVILPPITAADALAMRGAQTPDEASEGV
ncbi:sensor histidine kinase [Microbacterium sediminicola]|uniref:histidine kinase n=1 Tax=Microbacterium sediminicola TaxID=415210 RepID=A0ABN2HVX3_9MICO